MPDFLKIPLLAWVALTVVIVAALPRESADTPEARGRSVYAGEGCVHCHSQYVRPLVADTDRWGTPSRRIAALVGNRRQGPDLASIGRRADAVYLRLHLRDPAAVKRGTVMPSYAELFAPGDRRGEDLVAYLLSLRGDPAP